jgi:hypothetical protein
MELAVPHQPTHLGLVERGGEFRTQPEQRGLSLGLGALGYQQTFPLRFAYFSSTVAQRKNVYRRTLSRLVKDFLSPQTGQIFDLGSGRVAFDSAANKRKSNRL